MQRRVARLVKRSRFFGVYMQELRLIYCVSSIFIYGASGLLLINYWVNNQTGIFQKCLFNETFTTFSSDHARFFKLVN